MDEVAMPQHFSEEEKERIKERLFEVGEKLFAQYGVIKTSVDNIVGEAGIAKGSFYRFFKNKEELFMQISWRIEERTRETMQSKLIGMEGMPVDQQIAAFFKLQFKLLEDIPFYKTLTDPKEINYLIRKAGPEYLAQSRTIDIKYMNGLLEYWKSQGAVFSIDPTLIMDAMMGLFTLVLHKDDFISDFPAVLDFYIDAFITKILS
jgi:AcrR family transcriptional regulator